MHDQIDKHILARSTASEPPWVLEQWRSSPDGLRFIGVREEGSTFGAAASFTPSRPSDISHAITAVTKIRDQSATQTIVYGATGSAVVEVRLQADAGGEFTAPTIPLRGEATRAFALTTPADPDGTLIGLAPDGTVLYKGRVDDQRAEIAEKLRTVVGAELEQIASGSVGSTEWHCGVAQVGDQITMRIRGRTGERRFGSGSHAIHDLEKGKPFRILHGHSNPTVKMLVGLVDPRMFDIVGRTDDGRVVTATRASWRGLASEFFILVGDVRPIVEVSVYDEAGTELATEPWPPRVESPPAAGEPGRV